jgi:hypothetical protein
MPFKRTSLKAKYAFRFVRTLAPRLSSSKELPPGQQQFIVIDESKPAGFRVTPATRARARVVRTRDDDA